MSFHGCTVQGSNSQNGRAQVEVCLDAEGRPTAATTDGQHARKGVMSDPVWPLVAVAFDLSTLWVEGQVGGRWTKMQRAKRLLQPNFPGIYQELVPQELRQLRSLETFGEMVGFLHALKDADKLRQLAREGLVRKATENPAWARVLQEFDTGGPAAPLAQPEQQARQLLKWLEKAVGTSAAVGDAALAATAAAAAVAAVTEALERTQPAVELAQPFTLAPNINDYQNWTLRARPWVLRCWLRLQLLWEPCTFLPPLPQPREAYSWAHFLGFHRLLQQMHGMRFPGDGADGPLAARLDCLVQLLPAVVSGPASEAAAVAGLRTWLVQWLRPQLLDLRPPQDTDSLMLRALPYASSLLTAAELAIHRFIGQQRLRVLAGDGRPRLPGSAVFGVDWFVEHVKVLGSWAAVREWLAEAEQLMGSTQLHREPGTWGTTVGEYHRRVHGDHPEASPQHGRAQPMTGRGMTPLPAFVNRYKSYGSTMQRSTLEARTDLRRPWYNIHHEPHAWRSLDELLGWQQGGWAQLYLQRGFLAPITAEEYAASGLPELYLRDLGTAAAAAAAAQAAAEGRTEPQQEGGSPLWLASELEAACVTGALVAGELIPSQRQPQFPGRRIVVDLGGGEPEDLRQERFATRAAWRLPLTTDAVVPRAAAVQPEGLQAAAVALPEFEVSAESGASADQEPPPPPGPQVRDTSLSEYVILIMGLMVRHPHLADILRGQPRLVQLVALDFIHSRTRAGHCSPALGARLMKAVWEAVLAASLRYVTWRDLA